MIAFLILTLLLAHSSKGYVEEGYFLDSLEPEDYQSFEADPDPGLEVKRGPNDNFLRFGRNKKNYDFDNLVEDYARPTRSNRMDKNDLFIRFGRSKQDFLRFGRGRDNHVRFGRSTKRSKRDTYSEENKRGSSNFVRFGRNTNFMRFGRNEAFPTAGADMGHQDHKMARSPLLQLLEELLRQEKKSCLGTA